MESKKALVLGLGTSGYASALYLAERGWSVRVMDTRREPSLLARLKEHPEISFTGGTLDPAAVEGTSLVVISPGLSPEFSDAAPVVSEAKKLGIEVVGEIELFARELARLREEKGYHPKVIGITGTNGKTTTTSLTAKMLNAGGVSAVAAGNIGPNAVTELTEHDKAGTLPDAWVLELSSFQLQTTESLFCDAAAITNVTEDHIDWHGNFDAYLNAKRRILKPETLAVLNREDPLSAGSALPGEKTETFGSDAPKAPGEWGIAERDGVKWLAAAEASDDGVRLQYLMPAGALKIRGVHNAMNALTSLALARAAGASRSHILFSHLLPGAAGEFFVLMTIDTGAVILMISSLSFLGLGTQPPTPEWGMMLSEAKNVLSLYPWQMLPPGLAILITVAAFNFLGDSLRDVFDMRHVTLEGDQA